jgi:hypothetical protein
MDLNVFYFPQLYLHGPLYTVCHTEKGFAKSDPTLKDYKTTLVQFRQSAVTWPTSLVLQ